MVSEVFHFQAEADPPELVLPALLREVMLLRCGFQGIGTSPLGVPKLSLQVFFTFFIRDVCPLMFLGLTQYSSLSNTCTFAQLHV